MASSNLSLIIFIAMMVASIQFYTATAQTRHVVGGALGWGIPTNGAATYTTWASQQTYSVGDILFFNYTNGMHDVAEVSAASYDPCIATNPISLTTTGPTTLTLTTAGMHYYICTFASHCQIGQKLTINVFPSTTATPPSMPPMMSPPSMTPPTTTPMPPMMPPMMTPPSPPPTTTPMPPMMPPMMSPPSPSPTTTPMPPMMSPPSPSPTTTPMPPMMSPPSPSPTTSTPPMMSPPSMTPPSPSPTSTPPPMPMTPDAPGSGAPSLTAIVPATLLAIGLAFLNY